jgi:hypothetical protein
MINTASKIIKIIAGLFAIICFLPLESYSQIKLDEYYECEFSSLRNRAQFYLIFSSREMQVDENTSYNLLVEYCDDYNQVCFSDGGRWEKKAFIYSIVGASVYMPSGYYPWVGIVFQFSAWSDQNGNLRGYGKLAENYFYDTPIFTFGRFSGNPIGVTINDLHE